MVPHANIQEFEANNLYVTLVTKDIYQPTYYSKVNNQVFISHQVKQPTNLHITFVIWARKTS